MWLGDFKRYTGCLQLYGLLLYIKKWKAGEFLEYTGWKDSFKTNRKEIQGLAVVNSGCQKCSPAYTWGFGMRDHFLIHLIVSGKGTYECQQNTLHLAAGNMFLVYPETLVCYKADATDPWEYYWVGFQGCDAHYLVELCGFKRSALVLDVSAALEEIKTCLVSIHKMRGSNITNDLGMTSSLYMFFNHLITCIGNAHQGVHRSPLEQALRYINGHYSETINIQLICEQIGISRSHLYRLFMQELGVSPIDYLTEKRIAEACRLFRFHDISVNEAAYSVGFSDPLYFSRVFKKLRQISPGEFRLQFRKT
jgi:AraC-like DNA-binding protein